MPETPPNVDTGPAEPDKRVFDPLVVPVITIQDIPKRLHVPTPSHMPDYVLAAVTPIAAIFTRAAKTYVNTLGGMLVAVPASGVSPGDFWHTLKVAAGLAIAPAVVSLVTNTGLLLSKLDQKFPSLQA